MKCWFKKKNKFLLTCFIFITFIPNLFSCRYVVILIELRVYCHFHNYYSSKIMGCCSRNCSVQSGKKEKKIMKSFFKISDVLKYLYLGQLFFCVIESKAVARTGCSHQATCETCSDVNVKIPILAVSKAIMNINGDIVALNNYFPKETDSRETLSEVRRVLRVSRFNRSYF